ncbi:MAG: hypothetical protein AB7F74_21275 [Parvibaculaceae bacterium]
MAEDSFYPAGLILLGNRWLTPQERLELWWEQEASHHFLACPRYPVARLEDLLPAKYLTSLQSNERLADCCRRPREHDIEAFYSSEADKMRGVPDIYVLHCACGRKHRRFCVGGSAGSGAATEPRPFWEVR